jgi:periplasmic divalent cation tolerance protein
MADFCQLYLTCADKPEAAKITDTLLVKQLITCAKQFPVSSTYRWRGKIQHSDEVMLLMESRLDLFEKIEQEITKLHSYDSFVLEATTLSKVSKKAEAWLAGELK